MIRVKSKQVMSEQRKFKVSLNCFTPKKVIIILIGLNGNIFTSYSNKEKIESRVLKEIINIGIN